MLQWEGSRGGCGHYIKRLRGTLHGHIVNTGVLREPPTTRLSRRERRTLAFALGVSFLAHAALLGLLVLPTSDDVPEPRTLEVVIAEPPRPLPAVEEPKKAAPAPRREREAERRVEARRRQEELPRPVEPQPRIEPQPQAKPLIALPAEAPAPPVFTVPQPPAAETRAAAPEAPKAGSGQREGTGTENVPTTPPSFNAAYLRNDPPRYPPSARRNGVEGRVNLRVRVTRDGRAAQVQVHESSGSTLLDNAALEAVKNWQFVPARRGQEAIESTVIVPIVFRLDKTG